MSRKISIVIDAQVLANTNLTGVGKTTYGLVRSLAEKYPNSLDIYLHSFGTPARKPNLPNVKVLTSTWFPVKLYNFMRRFHLSPPYELFTRKHADFYLFPAFLPRPTHLKTPNALFLHDLTYLLKPAYVSRRNCYDLTHLMPRAIKQSDFIVTNSNSSKSGIIEAYGMPSKKIIVEYIPPVDTVKLSDKEATKRTEALDINSEYILFFGTLEPRKNLVSLLKAYNSLSDSLRNKYALVIAGGKGWNDQEILAELNHLKQTDANIIQTGYVSDEDRAALFMKTALYIMPSYYEGFGMQLLEAMTYKSPMLVSDIPVLREIAGNAAVYCGTSPKAIKEGIETTICDLNKKAAMIAAGQKRLQFFSWDKVASEIYEHIEEAVHGTNCD